MQLGCRALRSAMKCRAPTSRCTSCIRPTRRRARRRSARTRSISRSTRRPIGDALPLVVLSHGERRHAVGLPRPHRRTSFTPASRSRSSSTPATRVATTRSRARRPTSPIARATSASRSTARSPTRTSARASHRMRSPSPVTRSAATPRSPSPADRPMSLPEETSGRRWQPGARRARRAREGGRAARARAAVADAPRCARGGDVPVLGAHRRARRRDVAGVHRARAARTAADDAARFEVHRGWGHFAFFYPVPPALVRTPSATIRRASIARLSSRRSTRRHRDIRTPQSRDSVLDARQRENGPPFPVARFRSRSLVGVAGIEPATYSV